MSCHYGIRFEWERDYGKAKRVEVAYYTSNTSHPGFLRENLDFTKTFVDTCLAEVPGEGLADALRTELEHQIRVVDAVYRVSEWSGGTLDEFNLPPDASDELEYIALVRNDIRDDKNSGVNTGGLPERIREHLAALTEGLRYLEQQRELRLRRK